MEYLSSDDSEDEFFAVLDELDDRIFQLRGPRHIRPRTDLFNQFPDVEFRIRYRISRLTALMLFDQISENLQHFETDRNFPLSPMNRLLMTLRFYATGSQQSAVGDLVGVHKSTVSRVIREVTHAIALLRPQSINMPRTPAERATVMRGFFDLAGDSAVPFPGVIGTMDCTHIRIRSPGGPDAETFRNRKGWFSINVQSVADANLKFLNIVARWHGSAHDSTIFLQSRVNAQFHNREFANGHLLADAGYAVSPYVLTPLANPRNQAERHYNRSQIKTRNTVERKYGVWKQRFPCLGLILRTKLNTSCSIIIATAVMHNLCIDNGERDPPPIEDDVNVPRYDAPPVVNEQANAERRRAHAAGAKRRLLINNYFAINRARDELIMDQFMEEVEEDDSDDVDDPAEVPDPEEL